LREKALSNNRKTILTPVQLIWCDSNIPVQKPVTGVDYRRASFHVD
jgi:hypothetical protein